MTKSILEPALDQVLIADRPQTDTIDGIDLPENIRQREMLFGLVVFIGPDVTPRTKVQDLVCYGPYAGKMVVIEGVELRLMKEKQIEGYVRSKPTEPERFNPTNDYGVAIQG